MLKKLLFLGLMCFALRAVADQDYELVTPVQPVQNADKVEVIEFFWYGCPHCYHLEPSVAAWLKTKPANVDFIRQPAIFSELWGRHAKAFFTAEALGVGDKLHAGFFDAIQNKNQKLATEDDLAKFFVAQGVKSDDFHAAYNSFGVDAKVRQAETMAARYGITGVPAFVVNGKYRVTAKSAQSQDNMFAVINRLIQQESAKK
ncbi:MAG: thiol:disulfide interchange protein DsbA/DsbL [Methylomonas sp.]|nr:thiol:disulfide interchange protein DsbA/DsbL [Methylomonas sp.]PPD19873.1 MAG: disulfide bond formation protein DsbA [Methylomonas sp.]PPD25440.1 MAG: disulfide bond formation protein DsbA [Methylomonas sp.]PPD36085.1 MAG: disulfide bond formation protein DsbA [Methylomonas sp.]PPD39402.1 MAG: disulfide bond formation protein DsbA [Methylomonas sp.]